MSEAYVELDLDVPCYETEGKTAFERGESINANPYRNNMRTLDASVSWDAGWQAAKLNRKA